MNKLTLARRLMLSIAAFTFFAGVATAAVTLDRNYKLGEGAGEGGANGAVVGSGHSIPGAGDTLDDIGPSGAFLDLIQSGNPTYINVFSGAKARPGTAAGALGVQFDGVDDHLQGIPLNRPDELATLVGGSYPFNYTGIVSRGLQAWVYPDQAGLDAGAFQSIVSDTVLSGGPAINAAGQWTQINSEHVGADIPGTVNAVGNAWQHVMHHNYHIAGNNFRSVLYVNGIAVSANIDGIPTGGSGAYTDLLVVGASEVAGDGVTPTFGHHFRGVIDNLQMYVVGDNSVSGGQNYGSFNLFADNAWIAAEIAKAPLNGTLAPGDVNKSGAVDSADVTAFVNGWLSEKTLQGAHGTVRAGDWGTWNSGDMNHDGITDLADAFIMHQSLLSAGLGGLNFSLLGIGVPEPSSIGLATIGLAVVMSRAQRRRS